MRRHVLSVALLVAVTMSACIIELSPIGEPADRPLSGQEMSLAFLDVGQGDAILVISPNGKTMLVDGGNSGKDADEVILPYLERLGFDKLDVMVLTHPDADHVGGLPAVLRQIPVEVVISTGQVHTTQVYAEFLQEVKKARDEHGSRVIRGVAGAEIPFDPSVRVEVLGPSEEAIGKKDLNNASIVLRLSFGSARVLLTGDAETAEERWMIDRGFDLRAHLLKVSHHGSRTGTSDALLRAVGAEVGLISCGATNRYGHPDNEVLNRLTRYGVKTYRTDQQGTIVARIDEQGYWIETER